MLQVIPHFRIRTIPVLGTSPALFGMAAASWILCKLAKQPYFPEPVFRIKRGQYETILETLQEDDLARLGHCDDISVDLEEVRPLSVAVCFVRCSVPPQVQVPHEFPPLLTQPIREYERSAPYVVQGSVTTISSCVRCASCFA